MGDKTRGLYNKFTVIRSDGKDNISGKHHSCEYFVLDMTHDKYALPAIAAYARSCKVEYPLLAAHLRAKYPAPPPPADIAKALELADLIIRVEGNDVMDLERVTLSRALLKSHGMETT